MHLGFVFQTKFAGKIRGSSDFCCKGQPTNMAGPLDHPSEPNSHKCKPDKGVNVWPAGVVLPSWLAGPSQTHSLTNSQTLGKNLHNFTQQGKSGHLWTLVDTGGH
jgi:hypothetical protein